MIGHYQINLLWLMSLASNVGLFLCSYVLLEKWLDVRFQLYHLLELYEDVAGARAIIELNEVFPPQGESASDRGGEEHE